MRLFPTYLALPFLLALLCCACQPAAAPSTEAPFPYQEASIAELQEDLRHLKAEDAAAE